MMSRRVSADSETFFAHFFYNRYVLKKRWLVNQPQPQPGGLEEKIAALEAELFRAYKIIKNLREENERLREEKAYWQRNIKLPSTIIESKSPLLPTQVYYQTQSSLVNQKGVKVTRLARLKFASITVFVATLVVLSGLFLMRLIGKQDSSLPKVAKPLPTSAPAPVNFPPSYPEKTHLSKQKSELVYNVKKPANYKYSQDLQAIVNEVVEMAAAKQLPLSSLSISLIDLKKGETAGYQSEILRFPASISKLFWMVALYAQVENGILPREVVHFTEECNTDICKMIQKSDNEAASRILDKLTGTTSGENLKGKEYDKWLSERKQINKFYQLAGYKDIDISQKNFPIPYLKMEKPQGRDLQMRGDASQPIRNKISTAQTARLMSEIFTSQAVSPIASQEMMRLLTRDLRPEVWKQEQYNSIQGFFGEYLPIEEVYFASKVGWTLGTRQEAAYIATKDGKIAYILVIFGDAPAYGNDWKIFPEMSLLVFNRMKARSY